MQTPAVKIATGASVATVNLVPDIGKKPDPRLAQVWATRVPLPTAARRLIALKPSVPSGHWGLVLDASSTPPLLQRYLAGTKVSAPAAGGLWWLKSEPWVFQFTPQAQAPSAWLEASLAPFMPSGQVEDALIKWLHQHEGDLTHAHLADLLASQPALKTLPPCATPDELEARAQRIHNQLSKLGLACNGLRRVKPPAAQSSGKADHAVQPTSPSAQRNADIALWRDVVAADEALCSQLPATLNSAAQRFDEAVRQSTSTLGQTAPQWRGLAGRLSHIASTFNRLPNLAAAYPAKHGPSSSVVSAISANMQTVVASLAQLRELASAAPLQADVTTQAANAVNQLEQVLEQRRAAKSAL